MKSMTLLGLQRPVEIPMEFPKIITVGKKKKKNLDFSFFEVSLTILWMFWLKKHRMCSHISIFSKSPAFENNKYTWA